MPYLKIRIKNIFANRKSLFYSPLMRKNECEAKKKMPYLDSSPIYLNIKVRSTKEVFQKWKVFLKEIMLILFF